MFAQWSSCCCCSYIVADERMNVTLSSPSLQYCESSPLLSSISTLFPFNFHLSLSLCRFVSVMEIRFPSVIVVAIAHPVWCCSCCWVWALYCVLCLRSVLCCPDVLFCCCLHCQWDIIYQKICFTILFHIFQYQKILPYSHSHVMFTKGHTYLPNTYICKHMAHMLFIYLRRIQGYAKYERREIRQRVLRIKYWFQSKSST